MNETTLETRFEITPKGRAAAKKPRPIVITQDAKDAFISRDLLRRALATLTCNNAEEHRIIGGVIACYLNEPLPASCENCGAFTADCVCSLHPSREELDAMEAQKCEEWEAQHGRNITDAEALEADEVKNFFDLRFEN